VAIEVGAFLNGERFVANIADDMRLGPKKHVAALNWTFDSAVDDHAFRGHGSVDMCSTGDHEGRAMKFAINLAIDLD
jgi:hypothetical protein